MFIASSIVNSLSGHNTLEVELDSASIKSRRGSFSGGVVGSLLANSINDISVIVKNYLNVSGSSGGGGVLYDTGINLILNLNAIIDTLTVECNYYGTYGGVIGIVEMGARINVNLKGSSISMIDRFPINTDYKLLGAFYGEIRNNVKKIDNNIQINNVIIEGGVSSIGSVIDVTLLFPQNENLPQNENRKTTLIREMHVKIEASEANAIGIGGVFQSHVQKSAYLPSFYKWNTWITQSYFGATRCIVRRVND